eukprot:5099537-Amphidinium_carterae.1
MVRRRQDEEEEELEAERNLATHQRLLEEKKELETRLRAVNEQLSRSQAENRQRLDRLIARRQAIAGTTEVPPPQPVEPRAKGKAKRSSRANALTSIPIDQVPKTLDTSSPTWRTAVAAE